MCNWIVAGLEAVSLLKNCRSAALEFISATSKSSESILNGKVLLREFSSSQLLLSEIYRNCKSTPSLLASINKSFSYMAGNNITYISAQAFS